MLSILLGFVLSNSSVYHAVTPVYLYARIKFASGVALVPVPVTRIPLTVALIGRCPSLPPSNSNRHSRQLVGSGQVAACDRGGVRNGSFPPLITGSRVLHTTVPVHVLVASTDQLRQSPYRPIGRWQ
jgi:hypothetical protein